MAEQKNSEIRYLTAPSIDTKKKKYCRFKKSGIKLRQHRAIRPKDGGDSQTQTRRRNCAVLP